MYVQEKNTQIRQNVFVYKVLLTRTATFVINIIVPCNKQFITLREYLSKDHKYSLHCTIMGSVCYLINRIGNIRFDGRSTVNYVLSTNLKI